MLHSLVMFRITTKPLLGIVIAVLIIVIGTAWYLTEWPKTTLAPTPPAQTSSLSAENEESPATSCQLSSLPQQNIKVGQQSLTVAVAGETAERAKGLSGCDQIAPMNGMLFLFPEAKEAAFWMKEMRMPIDILWLMNGKVVGIESRVPAPAPNTPTTELIQYFSPGPIDAVLELPAGKAVEYGIVNGTTITLPTS